MESVGTRKTKSRCNRNVEVPVYALPNVSRKVTAMGSTMSASTRDLPLLSCTTLTFSTVVFP